MTGILQALSAYSLKHCLFCFLSAELPGAPSNLVISNISPRTATVRFRPGPDGKTAISRWIVEGQVRVTVFVLHAHFCGQLLLTNQAKEKLSSIWLPFQQVVKDDGKEEEWKVVYQKDNQPDADTLEIPDLTPFTQYRWAANTHIPRYHLHTHTYNQQLPQTHLTLHQVLLYCSAQEKLDKSHRHTERQFHLRLFCLSAPSQLLHADPYYPPATSQREGEGWGRGEKRWSESGKGSRTH